MEKFIEIEEMTIDKVQEAYRKKSFKAVDLVDFYLKRIEALDRKGPELNSIITVNSRARKEADELDKFLLENGKFKGKLHGIPIVVKDQVETKNLATTYGSIAFKNYIPSDDATVIKKLKNEGAIILAKTNLPDFATAWVGLSSAIGYTKNPYDLGRDSGGSSSGTGVSVAANLALVGLGEDTGGSIRVPSSFNNLFGLKVTTGLISRYGVSPLVHFYDSTGPMCRTVSDLAKVLDSIVGFDPNDSFTSICSQYENLGHFSDSLDSEFLKNKRIGVLREAFGTSKESEQVNEVVNLAIHKLQECGAEIIDPVSIEGLSNFINETALYILQSRYDLNKFISNKLNSPVPTFDYIYDNKLFPEKLDLIHEIHKGPKEPWDDEKYYERRLEIENFRRNILFTMSENKLDALTYPSVQVIPPTKEEVDSGKWTVLTFPTNTLIATQSVMPAISMPAGFTENEIPVGIEILGKQFSEFALINMAYSYEKKAKTRRKPRLE
jgi:Asp-tRNA(Asn)/Glu-tRNA(Gln) amidotransferase A subunit family amidase